MLIIDVRDEVIGTPYLLAAGLETLQVVDGSVALVNQSRIEACFLELPIDVAGEYGHTM